MPKRETSPEKRFRLLILILIFTFPDPYTSLGLCVMIMVFNATLNNISVTSLKSILLEEETGVPEENH